MKFKLIKVYSNKVFYFIYWKFFVDYIIIFIVFDFIQFIGLNRNY